MADLIVQNNKNMEEKVQTSSGAASRVFFITLFIYGVERILAYMLREAFSMDNRVSHALAMLLSFLSAYPLFVRRTDIVWAKGKKWTILTWSIFSVIMSVLVYIILRLVD